MDFSNLVGEDDADILESSRSKSFRPETLGRESNYLFNFNTITASLLEKRLSCRFLGRTGMGPHLREQHRPKRKLPSPCLRS